jgi:hypothetical protein
MITNTEGTSVVMPLRRVAEVVPTNAKGRPSPSASARRLSRQRLRSVTDLTPFVGPLPIPWWREALFGVRSAGA